MILTFLKVFGSVFVAELGDKTQLTCLAFASVVPKYRGVVFLASVLALAFSSAIAVFFGCQITRIISPRTVKLVAGVVFLIFGVIYLRDAWLTGSNV